MPDLALQVAGHLDGAEEAAGFTGVLGNTWHSCFLWPVRGGGVKER